MAKPTSGQPTEDATTRGTPVNVNEATLESVSVTRMDVATGDIKELQADLLKEICDCIEAQTETLAQVFTKHQEKLARELNRVGDEIGGGKGVGGRSGGGGGGSRGQPPGGGGGSSGPPSSGDFGSLESTMANLEKAILALIRQETGGGEGGSSGSAGDVARARQEFEPLADAMDMTRIEFTKWHKMFGAGIMSSAEANIREFNTAIVRAGQNLADLGKGVSTAWAETKRLYEVSQTGLIEVTAIFEDLGAAALQGRDAMAATATTIQKMVSEGIATPIGVLGKNVEDVAMSFQQNRKLIDEQFGEDYLQRIPFDEQNVILTEILNQNRRMGVQATNSDILQSRSTRGTLDTLKLIAASTGKTVEAVMGLYKEEAKTYEQLAAMGIITEQQAKDMSATSAALKTMGMEGAAEIIRKAVEEGGIQSGLTLMQAEFPGLSQFLGKGNNRAMMQDAIETMADNSMTAAERADRIADLFANMDTAGMSPEQMARLRKMFPILGELTTASTQARERAFGRGTVVGGDDRDPTGMKEVADNLAERDAGFAADITGGVNALREWLTNNLGAMGPLIAAVIANTAALIANTAALSFGGITRMIGGLFGGTRRLMGGLFGRMGGLLRGLGTRLGTMVTGLRAALGIGGAVTATKMALETPDQAEKRIAQQAAKKGTQQAAKTGGAMAAAKAGAKAGGKVLARFIPGVGWALLAADAARLGGWAGEKLNLGDWLAPDEYEGQGRTLGTMMYDWFGGDSTDEETKKRMDAEVAQLKARARARAEARKQAAASATMKGVAPQKGVAPTTGLDPAATAPSEAAVPTAPGPEDDPIKMELVTQTQIFREMVAMMAAGNSIGEEIRDGIATIGFPTTGMHSPPGLTAGTSGPADAYTPLMEETPY